MFKMFRKKKTRERDQETDARRPMGPEVLMTCGGPVPVNTVRIKWVDAVIFMN